MVFVAIRYNILSKYRVESDDSVGTGLFLQFNASKVFIPVSVSVDYDPVSAIIEAKIKDGKWCDWVFLDIRTNTVRSIWDKGIVAGNIATLPLSFQFYNVLINNKDYILGIDYLSPTSVRKVRFSKSGVIIESIIDHK